MKIFLTFLLLLSFLFGFSQGKEDITFGKREYIHSDVLNEQREIWIYTPEELGKENKNQNVYPVVYLLDGEYNFKTAASTIDFLSKNDLCPKMILVGIINKNRGRDFTPTHLSSWPESGGAANFLKFLKDELIPQIDTIYPTASYKLLMGHSLSGTFAVYSMIHFPELFNSYVFIDPNICWDKNLLFSQLNESAEKIDLSDENIYLSYTFWDKMLDSTMIRTDTSEMTECIRTKFTFFDSLDSFHVNARTKFYRNETHSSLSLISIYDGINYIFDYYRPPVLYNNIDSLNNAKGMILNYYKNVSDKIGFRVLPPENLIESLHYLFYLNNLQEKIPEINELKDLKIN